MQVYRINPSGTTYDIADHPVAGCRAWSPRPFYHYYIEVSMVTREGVHPSERTEIRVCMTDVEFERLVQALADAKAQE